MADYETDISVEDKCKTWMVRFKLPDALVEGSKRKNPRRFGKKGLPCRLELPGNKIAMITVPTPPPEGWEKGASALLPH